MSVLKIEYAGLPVFEGEVESFGWTDIPGHSVTVTGQLPKAKAGGGLSAIADMISQASKAKTEQKRAELIEESDG